MRYAGILMPISSLPSPYGIGSFSESAREFVDQLVLAGQHYWQILPLGPTGYGDSPYQSFSAFAGNPYFIDLDALIEEGLLNKREVEQADFGQSDPGKVDYYKLYTSRFKILKLACSRSSFEETEEYREFDRENSFWLDDYALFMAIKNQQGGRSVLEWPDPLRKRDPEALKKAEEELKDEIRFFNFIQYEFDIQWRALKKYANEKGVEIIGDIPIYVSPDSSDFWADPEMFQVDENIIPTGVAGCPPDAFSADGQLWGNPLYNWDFHEKTHFAWWKKRIAHCLDLYDVVRVDHFRGFDEYYSIPYGDINAKGGSWKPGPGMKLFLSLAENPKVTSKSIIAEDLGFLTPSVIQLVKDSGFPGMKVIEFAFDSRDTGSGYLPYGYIRNTIVYTGTHDNQTLKAWYENELEGDDKKMADDYLGLDGLTIDQKVWQFIRMAMGSVSDTCVIPIQDYLCLDGSARMNHPSTTGGNWCWRLKEGQFSDEVASRIRRLTELTGRTSRKNR